MEKIDYYLEDKLNGDGLKYLSLLEEINGQEATGLVREILQVGFTGGEHSLSDYVGMATDCMITGFVESVLNKAIGVIREIQDDWRFMAIDDYDPSGDSELEQRMPFGQLVELLDPKDGLVVACFQYYADLPHQYYVDVRERAERYGVAIKEKQEVKLELPVSHLFVG